MKKEEVVELSGVVTESLSNAQFLVRLDQGGRIIRAYVSGKMRKNQIRVLVGDHVTVEMTPYDLDRGRISFRAK